MSDDDNIMIIYDPYKLGINAQLVLNGFLNGFNQTDVQPMGL